MTNEHLLLIDVAYIIAHEDATSLSELHAIWGRIAPLDKQSPLGALHDRAQELLLRAWRHHSGAARLVVVE